MLKRIVLAFAIAAAGLAQEAPKSPAPAKYYKLEFVVKEVEGAKVLNARSYSTTVSADMKDYSQIRASSRVPIQQPGNQITYVDVGVSIDCRNIKEEPRGVSLGVTADISSVPSEPGTPAGPPTIRQNKWTGSVIVPLKKPTLIFSSDDLTSKRQMQLEITATPIA